MEQTDVQKRNEEEVQRILRERGFETASESKPKEKRQDYNFGIIGKMLFAIIIIGGLSFGALSLINAPKSDETAKDASTNENTAQNANYAGLEACLGTAYANVEAGDPQFYSKLIASYQAQLDCHAKYPTPGNESEISGIERRKNSVEIAAKDASENQSDIDSAYNSASQQTAGVSQPTTTQNIDSNYTAPDCSDEEREVEIRLTLAEREEQQYNNIFSSRKSYSELLDQAGGSFAQADILYLEQKAKIDAAWQTYLNSQDAYQSAYNDMLSCEHRQ